MPSREETGQTQHDDRVREIIDHAALVFAQKGYHNASMRDISARTGTSLAGLYHYFSGKEEILYLIQDDTLGRLLAELEQKDLATETPEERVRTLVESYLSFFLRNRPAMKVLSHEAGALEGDLKEQVAEKKRRLTALTMAMMRDLKPSASDPDDSRIATFTLFGMLNWIYTWYGPDEESGPEKLAERMTSIFLWGYAPGGDKLVMNVAS